MNVVYVIGVPGAGKSTAVKRALMALHGGALSIEEVDTPVPHQRYADAGARPSGLWQIGRYRDTFGGTDTLGMAINPVACAWVERLHELDGGHPRVLIGEGDRLANARFLDAADHLRVGCPASEHRRVELRHSLTLVHLSTDVDTAHRRAAERARLLGTNEQNPTWWKGRVTKVANLVVEAETGRWGELVTIDGDRAQEEVSADLAEVINNRRSS